MATTQLSDAEIDRRLAELPGWQRCEGRLLRTFEFADFVAAFGWMTRVAIIAEKLDHHPDWKNVYRRVEVELSTHDAGGITERDLTVAAEMSRLAQLG